MILGKKIKFRAIEERDLPILAEWLNDPAMAHLVVGWTFPVSMSQQRDWFQRAHKDPYTQRWMIDTLDDETIGLTGLWDIDWRNRHALTAVKLGGKNIRGKGYGTDAIMTLMSYAFYQLGLHRLWGEILPYNTASYRAYVEKCGWKVEGVLRDSIFRDGKFFDLIRVAILEEDFRTLPRAAAYIPDIDANIVQIRASDWSLLPEHFATRVDQNGEP